MVNPEWFDAAAATAAAVEGGVATFSRKPGDKAVTPALATPAPVAAPTVVVSGISGQDFLLGMLILAAAVLAAALVLHHGLTA
jgi:hypothetical protein